MTAGADTVDPNDPEQLDALLDLATRAAAAAAGLHRRRATGDIDAKSSATDPVTAVDRDSESMIVDMILAERPDDGLVGEEGADRPSATGVRWVIDPLDGTVNYLYRYPAHAVSIAVEIDGEFVAGVVHQTSQPPAEGQPAPPADHDTVFRARRGGGAFADGRPIRCSEPTHTGGALLATGFGYDRDVRRRQGEVLAALLPDVRDIRRSGSCAIDLCLAAAGRVDAYYETGPNIWDVAAGVVILEEAGGRWSWSEPDKRICGAAATIWDDFSALVAAAERGA